MCLVAPEHRLFDGFIELFILKSLPRADSLTSIVTQARCLDPRQAFMRDSAWAFTTVHTTCMLFVLALLVSCKRVSSFASFGPTQPSIIHFCKRRANFRGASVDLLPHLRSCMPDHQSRCRYVSTDSTCSSWSMLSARDVILCIALWSIILSSLDAARDLQPKSIDISNVFGR